MTKLFLGSPEAGIDRFSWILSQTAHDEPWFWLEPEQKELSAAPFRGNSLVLPVSSSWLFQKRSSGIAGRVKRLVDLLLGRSKREVTEKLTNFFQTNKTSALVIQLDRFPLSPAISCLIQAAKLAGVLDIVLEFPGKTLRPQDHLEWIDEQQLMSKITAVVVPSGYAKKQLIQGRDLDPEKIQVIPPAQEEDLISPVNQPEKQHKQTKSCSVFLNLLDPEGTEVVAEAVSLFEQNNPHYPIKLVAQGGKSLQKILETHLTQRGVSAPIVFQTNPTSCTQQLADSQLVIFAAIKPQIYNRLVFLSLMLGVPILAGKSGAIGEQVIDQVTGFFVEPFEPRWVQKTMHQICIDAKLQTGLALSAKERFFRLFSQKKLWDSYQQLFGQS